MRENLPVTNKERNYQKHQRIVSTTTRKGLIGYVNDDFVDISGFENDELVGQAHNLVRHPDMPQAAFKDLWDTIKDNKPWMGLVKNRCKNGDYYWVDAFVTSTGSGADDGYQSVRIQPDKEAVNRADRIYNKLGPQGLPKPLGLISRLPIFIKALGLSFLALIIGLGAGLFFGSKSVEILGITLTLTIFLNAIFFQMLLKPWSDAAKKSESIFNNLIAKQVYTGRTDELGQLELVIKFLQAQQNTIIWRSSDSAGSLAKSASQANLETKNTQENMSALHQEVDLVSTAMTEMSATVQEIARNASLTSSTTQDAFTSVRQGEKVVQQTKQKIESLSMDLGESSVTISQLAKDSESIGSVIDVINSIAEQTNLLALNAAIEAARAGEFGRGFSVVADEVRSLAAKTQSSTGEIRKMINDLQKTAGEAVVAMNCNKTEAEASVTEANNATESLALIRTNMDQINDMSIQIATAAEEQSQVSEEINRNIVNINDSANHTLDGCHRVYDSNQNLFSSINNLKTMITQFAI